MDVDEALTEASDGCCLKSDQTIPIQTIAIHTNSKASLKQPKQVGS